jgi:RNA polymerase primary sigma factor
MPKPAKPASSKSKKPVAKKADSSPKNKAEKTQPKEKVAAGKVNAAKEKKVLKKEKAAPAKEREITSKNGSHSAPPAAAAAREEPPKAPTIISVIDQPDVQEKLRELVKLAKEQGYLTFDDLNEALPDNINDPDEMETIMGRLRGMEVDIIDASTSIATKTARKIRKKRKKKARGKARHSG